MTNFKLINNTPLTVESCYNLNYPVDTVKRDACLLSARIGDEWWQLASVQQKPALN